MFVSVEKHCYCTYAAFHWARKLVFPNSYFRVGSRVVTEFPSFPLGNTTTSMERYFLLVNS